MELYTSYFAKSGDHPDAVSIALSAPKFYKGKIYKPLMPTWDIVNGIKEGRITQDTYTTYYRNLINDRQLTPEKVCRDTGEGSILLCWEKPAAFCHRHIVADWLRQSGIEVSEL